MDAWELYQKIQLSEGMKLYWKMQELQASFSIFTGNLTEMLAFTGIIEQLYGAPKSGEEEKKQALRTAHRLLHNFLAGANTLIDHTRALVKDLYADTPFQFEYQVETQKRFAEVPIAGFVKCLRKWMVHRGPVPLCVVSTLDIDADLVTARLMLQVSDLKTWDRWDARAKTLLASLDKQASMAELIAQYAFIVEAFYEWFRIRLNEVHREAFAELNQMQVLYRAVIAEQNL